MRRSVLLVFPAPGLRTSSAHPQLGVTREYAAEMCSGVIGVILENPHITLVRRW